VRAARRWLYQWPMVVGPSKTDLGNVAVISLERWDDVWRRNQHLAARLPALGLADHVTFVNPGTLSGASEFSPVPGVTVISPRRIVPKRLGGLRIVASSVKRKTTRKCDTLWINDPTTGAWLSRHPRAVYDITDDWRCAKFTPREVRRLTAAEDVLARQARTVVCSEELRRRWKCRYGVEAVVVKNAVDLAAMRRAERHSFGSSGPHVGYVGTLHETRLDVALVLATADALPGGQLHLVGPDSLSDLARARLLANPKITLHGAVSASDVPSWLVSFDVLICPHVVTDFTLSLDAIKAYEYLATSLPVVATPTSGFQGLVVPGLIVTDNDFTSAVSRAAERGERFFRNMPDWDDRARQFAAALLGSVRRG
jgi:teichuronic acid biosynthesis glycosyltransferase TuaH